MCRTKCINYDNVYSSHGALLQPTAHALMPTGKVRKSDEMAGMMAGNADLIECCSCKRGTKYSCIKCKIPICNLCCQPEFDDSVNGWLMHQSIETPTLWVPGKGGGFDIDPSQKASISLPPEAIV